jgi:hypothetical protein
MNNIENILIETIDETMTNIFTTIEFASHLEVHMRSVPIREIYLCIYSDLDKKLKRRNENV